MILTIEAPKVSALNPRLSQIRINRRASQETPNFTAILEVAGERYEVSNEGRGGCNRYYPHIKPDLAKALDALCANNLPPIRGDKGSPYSLLMDFETWTFECAYDSNSKNRSAALLK